MLKSITKIMFITLANQFDIFVINFSIITNIHSLSLSVPVLEMSLLSGNIYETDNLSKQTIYYSLFCYPCYV